MDRWPPLAVLGVLGVVLTSLGWLLFSIIGYLRKTRSRYRWFELFANLFVAAVGFVMLLAYPRGSWAPWWWTLFACASILAGGIEIGMLLNREFSRAPDGHRI